MSERHYEYLKQQAQGLGDKFDCLLIKGTYEKISGLVSSGKIVEATNEIMLCGFNRQQAEELLYIGFGIGTRPLGAGW
jgi:hypothetical protein